MYPNVTVSATPEIEQYDVESSDGKAAAALNNDSRSAPPTQCSAFASTHPHFQSTRTVMATEESDLLEHEPEAMDVEGEGEEGGEKEADVLSDEELEKTAEEYARYLVVNCQKEVYNIINIFAITLWCTAAELDR